MLLVFMLPLLCWAQSTSDYQTWLDYNHKYKLNGNWVFFSDYGFRWSNLNNEGFWRIHARPSIEYRKEVIHTLRGGVGFFYQDNIDYINTLEIRPWQGYLLRWPNFGRFRFMNYVRTEQRFVNDLNDEGFAFTLKVRYRLGLDIPINNSIVSVGTFFVPISFELFGDLALVNQDLTSDRNRFAVGLGYRPTKDIRVQLRYTYQGFKNNLEGGAIQSDHILRFTMSQNFRFD